MNVDFKRVVNWTAFPALVLMVVVLLTGGVTTTYFFKYSFISRVWETYMPIILIALGLTAVIICGMIDLSAGTIAALVNCVSIYLIRKMGMDVTVALLVGVFTGLLFGVLNGILVSIFRLNALIATFATAWITGGLALWIYPDPSNFERVGDLARIYGKESYLGVPAPFYLLILALIVWYLIMKSSLGPQMYAMGGDVKKAFITGLNIKKITILSFTFSGFCAGLAGIAMIGVFGVGMAGQGMTYLLPAIAACVIGGLSLSGGFGECFGPIFGAFFLAFLTPLVLAVDIDPYFQEITKHSIVFGGIVLPSLIRFIIRRKDLHSNDAY